METPKTPSKGAKTEYHCFDSCNACGGENELINPSYEGSFIHEVKTKCKECGHDDYWAYGYFESSCEIESKCKKYSFD